MTADIRIRRLNLKVVQRGAPWLGRDELRHVGQMARGAVLVDLDRILERALAGCVNDEHLGEIAFDITLDSLRSSGGAPRVSRQVRAQLAAALEQAITKALADRHQSAAPDQAAASTQEVPAEWNDVAAARSPEQRLLELLLAWHAEGRLLQRVCLVPEATVARWLDSVMSTLALLPEAPPSAAPSFSKAVFDSSTPGPGKGAASVDLVLPECAVALTRLLALAASSSPFRPSRADVAALQLDRLRRTAHDRMPIEATNAILAPNRTIVAEGAATEIARTDAGPAMAADPYNIPNSATALSRASRNLPQRCAISTALPFLALGPLARIGWLVAVGAAPTRPAQTTHLPALGYALALKTLPAPARGWHHRPEDLAAAAFAGGCAEPPSGAALAAADLAFNSDLPAFNAVLADALLCGHDRNDSLIVVATPLGIGLLEPQGMFPLALGAEWCDIAPAAVAAGAPLVLDPQLPGAVCTEIDRAGLVFVAAGAPSRGEPWHALNGPGAWRGRTNAAAAQRPSLIEIAVRQQGIAGEARACLQALGPDRPLGPTLGSGPLDRAVTLAAALALGDISWRLATHAPTAWAHPDPLLALQRFGDLSATMLVTKQDLDIRLPLGPRSRDLDAAGLLADVERVPWLGRRLRFGIG